MAGEANFENVTTEGFLSSPFLSNLGAGILAANQNGARLPSAIGQGLLAANRGQREALQNQLIRSRLTSEKQKRDASAQLQGLLAGGNVDPSDPRVMGLLAQISPEGVAQGLLGQRFATRRPDSVLARLEAAGIDPQSPEGQELIRQSIGGGGNKELLDAMLKTLQIQGLQRDLDTATTEKDRKRTTGRISVINSIDRTREAAELNRRLRGTFAETGLGFNELRTQGTNLLPFLTEFFGGDSERARAVTRDVQRFQQLTTTEALQSLFGGQVSAGTITDTKLNTFLTTKPGIDRLPEVNNKIFADMLQSSLDSADNLGISLPDREAIEAEIEALRGTQETTTVPRPNPNTKQDRSDQSDQELFDAFSAKFPALGRKVNEADVRKTMRERNLTRAQVIKAMREQLESR